MESKEDRIAALQAQIEKIEKEPDVQSYELVKVTPDGGGVRDGRKTIAISHDKNLLIKYCNQEFNLTPTLVDKQPKTDKWFDSWYSIMPSYIAIINEI